MEPLSPSPDTPVRVRFDKEGVPFTVRRLTPADRSALLRFYDEFEPKRAAQGLPPKGTDRLNRWLDTILPNGIHLAVIRNDVLIGHALLVTTHAAGVSEYAVFLRADQRGRGIGTELNRVVADVAREAGLSRLWLSVELQNRAAIRSYEKAGFRFLPHTIYSAEAEMELVL